MGSDKARLTERIAGIFTHQYFLPSIAALGLVLRLALLYIARHNEIFADELDYQAIANSIWHNHQFILHGVATAYRPPAQPVFIAAIFSVFGDHPVDVKIAEALLLTPLPFLCSRLGRGIGLPVAFANLGALLATLHPALAYSATTLYPTVLTAVLLTFGLVACIAAEKDNDAISSVTGGLALGLAGMSTTTFAPLPVLIAIYCLWKRKFKAALIIAIVGMLPALVWIARNREVMGHAVIATNGGLNLLLGANDNATPESGNWVVPTSSASGELAIDAEFASEAKQWIKEHPARYAQLAVERAALVVDSTGNPKTKGLHSGPAERFIGWLMLPVVLLSLAGLWLYRKTAASWFTIAALFLVIATSAATIVKPRFRFPCDPTLAVFAAGALSVITSRKAEPHRA